QDLPGLDGDEVDLRLGPGGADDELVPVGHEGGAHLALEVGTACVSRHALAPSSSKMSGWTWCGSNSSGLYPPSDCPWLGSSHCTTSTPRHHVRSKPTTRARAPAGAAHPTLPSAGTVARKRA